MTYFERIKAYFEDCGESSEDIEAQDEFTKLVYRNDQKKLRRKLYWIKKQGYPKDYLDVREQKIYLYATDIEGECNYANKRTIITTHNNIIVKDSYSIENEDISSLSEDFLLRYGDWSHEYMFMENDSLQRVTVYGNKLDTMMFVLIEENSSISDYMIVDDGDYRVFANLCYRKGKTNKQKGWKYFLRDIDEELSEEIYLFGLKNKEDVFFKYINSEDSKDINKNSKVEVFNQSTKETELLNKYLDKIKRCEDLIQIGSKVKETDKVWEEHLEKVL